MKKTIILICAITIFVAVGLTTPQPPTVSANAVSAMPQATQEKPLDAEAVAALKAKLTDALKEAIEDEETQTSITEKWDARMEGLVGKTAKQVVELFMADVKSVVEDAETVNQLQESFTAAANETEQTAETEPSETPEPGEPAAAVGRRATTPTSKSAGAKPPLQDTQRFDAMKVTPMPSQTWTFNVKAGQITFWYANSTGYAEFKPNKTVGNSSIAWIQVVRTGGKDRWYGTTADINAFSKNNANFVLRTDPVYGFRVDKTKDENVPFYDQTTLKIGETLSSYRLAFDISDRNTTSGGSIRFSDQPQPGPALFKVAAVFPTAKEYRMYFLLSPMNTQTGEIYGTVEWAVAATLPTGVTIAFVPSLITKDIPELRGRELAFERWNTIVAKNYVPMPSVPPSRNARTVYPIPGKGVFWMK